MLESVFVFFFFLFLLSVYTRAKGKRSSEVSETTPQISPAQASVIQVSQLEKAETAKVVSQAVADALRPAPAFPQGRLRAEMLDHAFKKGVMRWEGHVSVTETTEGTLYEQGYKTPTGLSVGRAVTVREGNVVQERWRPYPPSQL